MRDMRPEICPFIDAICNTGRIHPALAYRRPIEIEQRLALSQSLQP
jgi:hypothetical protein